MQHTFVQLVTLWHEISQSPKDYYTICLHEVPGIGKLIEIERSSEVTENGKEDVDLGLNGTGFLTHCRCACCPWADGKLTAAKIANNILYVLYHGLLQKALRVYYGFPCLPTSCGISFRPSSFPAVAHTTLPPGVAEDTAELGGFLASRIWALPLAFLGVWCPN